MKKPAVAIIAVLACAGAAGANPQPARPEAGRARSSSRAWGGPEPFSMSSSSVGGAPSSRSGRPHSRTEGRASRAAASAEPSGPALLAGRACSEGTSRRDAAPGHCPGRFQLSRRAPIGGHSASTGSAPDRSGSSRASARARASTTSGTRSEPCTSPVAVATRSAPVSARGIQPSGRRPSRLQVLPFAASRQLVSPCARRRSGVRCAPRLHLGYAATIPPGPGRRPAVLSPTAAVKPAQVQLDPRHVPEYLEARHPLVRQTRRRPVRRRLSRRVPQCPGRRPVRARRRGAGPFLAAQPGRSCAHRNLRREPGGLDHAPDSASREPRSDS